MNSFNAVTFPPIGNWDRRLSEIACHDLVPVETLHENEWFRVCNRGGFYTMEYHLPQVIVLPVIEDSSIVMVRVKRPVIGDVSLELPAGGCENGEDPAMGGVRELAEETGIIINDASRLHPMPPLSISPTRCPKLIYVFRVGLTQREFENRGPHDDEIESVELFSMEQVANMIVTGEIYISAPIAIISTFLLSKNF